MKRATLFVFALAVALSLLQAPNQSAEAGYPAYVVQPAVPAVVGYSARRAGLFGRRVVVRPVVAAVPTAPPVVVARPVVRAYYAPPVQVVSPVVTTYRVGYPAYYYGY